MTNYILIALIVSVSIGEGIATKPFKLFACVRQQGRATLSIKTKNNGTTNMVINGRPRSGQPIEFDNFVIDKSKRCNRLKGDFVADGTTSPWTEDNSKYSKPKGDKFLKHRSFGNGYVKKNKGRVILYKQGDTIVGCGKLKAKKYSCKETDAPIALPITDSPTVTPVAATSAPTTLAPVATTGAPTTLAPVAATGAPTTLAPVATTGAPTTLAPVAATGAPTTLAPATTTGAPTTLAPVATTGAPTTLAPVAATLAPVAATGVPTTLAPVAATGAPTTLAPVAAIP